MKLFIELVVLVALTMASTRSFAACNCDDWVNRGGYCVDYVKTKIPAFPVPKSRAEIAVLKNKETAHVAEGDAAVFDLGTYWHVAYIEKVHRDRQGNPTAIDVSEMNSGGYLSLGEYASAWGSRNEGEWKRALCCGVTDEYDQTRVRTGVALDTVTQIWSPEPDDLEDIGGKRRRTVVERVREAVNRLIQFAERVL